MVILSLSQYYCWLNKLLESKLEFINSGWSVRVDTWATQFAWLLVKTSELFYFVRVRKKWFEIWLSRNGQIICQLLIASTTTTALSTFYFNACCRYSLAQEVDGLAGVDSGIGESHVVQVELDMSKVKGCLQTRT